MSCVAALFSPDAASFPTESILHENNDSHSFFQDCIYEHKLLCVRHSMKGVGLSPSPLRLRVHSRSAIADDHRYRRECPITCIYLATDGSSFSESTRLNLQEPDL